MKNLSRSAILQGYEEAVLGLGFDPLAFVREAGLPAECLHEPEIKIPSSTMLRLLEMTAERTGAADFGLRMAEKRHFSTLGAIGLLMLQQPDVRQALATMNSHFWAHGGGVTLQIEENEDLAILSLGIAHVPGEGIRQATELALAALAQILRRFLGPGWNPEAVGFSHPRITGLIRYTRIFGQLPLFGQERSSLALRAADLERTIPDADPAIAAELERYLNFREGPRARNFAEQVQELIRQSLSTGRCHAPWVAQQMGLSRRTLHRKLQECGTSFEALLQGVRLESASDYLNAGDRTLTEISELVGFAHLSAFARWRRKWMPNR